MSEKYMNPFDEPDNRFLVLMNHNSQYSLWPVFKEIPSGWESTFGPALKQDCLDYIEANWLDIRV